jgi:hypothetical protein
MIRFAILLRGVGAGEGELTDEKTHINRHCRDPYPYCLGGACEIAPFLVLRTTHGGIGLGGRRHGDQFSG